MGLRLKTVDSSLGIKLSSNANHSIADRYPAAGPLALTVDSAKRDTGAHVEVV